MKKSVAALLTGLTGLMFGSVALADSGMEAATNWGPLAAAIAIGLGAFGAATGQGRAASSALEGIARNPASRGEVFMPLILSLVFMELQALLCFVIAFMVKGLVLKPDVKKILTSSVGIFFALISSLGVGYPRHFRFSPTFARHIPGLTRQGYGGSY